MRLVQAAFTTVKGPVRVLWPCSRRSPERHRSCAASGLPLIERRRAVSVLGFVLGFLLGFVLGFVLGFIFGFYLWVLSWVLT